MKLYRWLMAPAVAALLVVGLACGGGDDDSSSTGSNNDAAAVSTGSSGSETASSDGGSATSQELDLTNAAQALMDVESFRFDMAMKLDFDMPDSQAGSQEDAFGAAMMAMLGNIRAEGAFVAPDSFEMQTQLFGQDLHIIQIGEEAWINDGSGWMADTAGSFSMFDGGSPTDMAFDMLPQDVLSGAETSQENVNGVDTTRYSFDKESLAALGEQFGEDMGDLSEIDTLSLDVWVTESGLPIKFSMIVDGESEGSRISMNLEFNITDLNNDGISIERPI